MLMNNRALGCTLGLLLVLPVLCLAGKRLFSRTGNPATVKMNVDPQALENHVHKLAEDFSPRDYEHLEHLNQAADYVKGRMAAAGGRVEEQTFYAQKWAQKNERVKRGPFRNLVASFGPVDGERIVVGAHYDGCGPYPAADDNASGVAALLELARLLGSQAPAVRVDLVAYSLEEPPFFATDQMGSVIHANALKKQGVHLRGMICLEMLGYFSDQPKSQAYPILLLKLLYPSRGNFIAVVGGFKDRSLLRTVRKAMRAGAPLPVLSLMAPAWLPGIDFSDHRSYWAAGYPAVMITDTAFYRNRRYHTPEDTPDTLDYARMAQVVEGVFRAVQNLANARR